MDHSSLQAQTIKLHGACVYIYIYTCLYIQTYMQVHVYGPEQNFGWGFRFGFSKR